METARSALIIAAHEFDDPRFQRLRSPAQDVEALAAVLGDPDVGGFAVQTVVNQANSAVQQEIERFFSSRRPEDLLLLYFSCHGVKDPTGRLYFATSNTTFDLLRSTGVSASFVSEQMEYSRSRRIVLLLDCCYSGAFLKGYRARGDDLVGVDQLEGRGRAVITASRATEYAFEADELAAEHARPSMFTGAVVEALRTGAADADGDGLITVDELYDYVYDAVRGKVAGQTPGRFIDVEGDLVVARNPNPPLRAAPLPAELRRAVESDAALQRLGAVAELSRWYSGGDAPRRTAAAAVLEQLCGDYDERVKVAARAALSPLVAEEPVPAPVPTAEPDAKAAPPEPATPGDGAPVDRPLRAVGRLAAAGAVALLVAPYLEYRIFDDWTETLEDRRWFSLGALAFAAMLGYAAYALLQTAHRRVTALALLAGALPVVLGLALVSLGELHKDAARAGPGWVLLQAGFALVAAAGVLATLALRSRVSLPAAALHFDARSALTALALLTGAVTTVGWARFLSVYGGLLPVSPPVTLALQLLTLGALVSLLGRRVNATPSGRRALLAGTLGLVILAVVVFVTAQEVSGDNAAVLAAFVVLAMGSAVVPALSTVLLPSREGAALLAGWVVASVVWVPASLAASVEAGVLAGALAGAALLAALVTRVAPPRQDTGRVTGARAAG